MPRGFVRAVRWPIMIGKFELFEEIPLRLEVHVDDDGFVIEVDEKLVGKAEEFFAKMDEDMAGGIQLGRQWVEAPSVEQRCQLVADRLLNAVMRADEQASLMMAGYILSRIPGVDGVRLDTSGELVGTEFLRESAVGQ